MDSDVIVTAKDGQVVVPSKNNSIFGYIRLEQVRMSINEDNWCNQQKVSALIRGTVINLKKLKWEEGEILPGKLKIVEQLMPFNTKNPERDIKVAGETGIVCTKDGEPIYRSVIYTQDTDAPDILVRHDNKEEIRKALAALEDKASL